MVKEFNHKVLGIKPTTVQQLNMAKFEKTATLSRIQLIEEANEFLIAVKDGGKVNTIDAVIDSIYFAYGILYKMGVTEDQFDQLFSIVHDANMCKSMGIKKGREGYDVADAVKPDNWVAPEKAMCDVLQPELKLKKSVIICGPNGAGKSTLAKELAAKYSVDIVHSTKPENLASVAPVATDQFNQFKTHKPVIYDRVHAISGLVYNRHDLDFTDFMTLSFISGLIAEYATLIYCTGDGKRDMNKPHYTEELKEATKDQTKIRSDYAELMLGLKHQEYNFEINDIGSLQLT